MNAITIAELNKLRPCPGAGRRVRAALRKFDADKARPYTAADARAAGCTFFDIVWAASAVASRDKTVERRLRHWMADCAARVLLVYEKQVPDDPRVRNAIVAARDFADDRIDADALAAAVAAAVAAARDAWAAAVAAASDADGAAASDADGAAWAARASRAAARDAWAAAVAAASDADGAAWAARASRAAAGDDERDWQFNRLILWLSDNEPSPLPLPEKIGMSA